MHHKQPNRKEPTMRNQPADSILKIYYSDKIDDLQKIKIRADYWLPQKSSNTLYSPGHVICTTNQFMLAGIEVAILDGKIPHNQVLWIDCTNPQSIISYTFGPTGKVLTFYNLGSSIPLE